MKTCWISGLLLVVVMAAEPALARQHRVPVEPGPSLLIDVPDAWHPLDMQDGNHTTVAFVTDDRRFRLMITVIDSAQTRAMPQDPASLRELAEDSAREVAPEAAAGAPAVTALQGPAVHGVWFSTTAGGDPPPQGEWRYSTHGLLSIGGLPGTFELQVDAEDAGTADALRDQVLAALRTLRPEG